MKRSISFLLIITLVASIFSALTISASAETLTSSDGLFIYTLSDNKATITKCLDTSVTNLNIPEEIDGYTVTGIAKNILNTDNSVKTLTIPETVTNIEDYAFKDWRNIVTLNYNAVNATAKNVFDWCLGLKTINFGEDVSTVPDYLCYNAFNVGRLNFNNKIESIGSYAFYKTSIAVVNLPQTVKYIGIGAFSQTKLTSINIPKSVDTLSNYIFANCRTLKEFTIGENIKTIGNNAFEDTGLVNIVVPDTVENFGEAVFKDCKELKTATLPQHLKEIPINTFSYCRNLSNFEFPKEVEKIGSFAFCSCDSLGDVIIPDTVYYIGTWAYAFSSVGNLTIPKSVVEIGNLAFNLDHASGTLYYDAINPIVGSEKNSTYFCFKKIVIGDNVRVIPDNFFTATYHVEEVSFGKNVREVPKDFLKDSEWYKSLPNGLIIRNNILLGYKGTIDKDLVIKNGVNNVASYAFSGSDVNSVTLPDSVGYVGTYAFSNCQRLNYIKISNSLTVIREYTFYNCTNLKEFSFPSTINVIGESAFENCQQMKISAYPLSVEKIEKKAFKNCKKICNFNFGNSLTTIEDYAFADCTKLTISKYSNKLKTIGNYAFSNCTSLTEFDLANSVEKLADYSFYNCTSLNRVSNSNLLNSFGENCFSNCYSLKSFSLSSSIKEIPASSFMLCRALTSIYIPDNVTKIGKEAFYKTGIKKINLPPSVTTIESYVFTPDGSVNVYGKVGSTAETYCNTYDYTFIESKDVTFNQTAELRKGNCEVLDLENIINTYSNNKSVATISGNKITAGGGGNTTVTVKLVTGEVYKINVKVIEPKISERSIVFRSGSAKTLSVTNGKVKSWSTSDSSIVTVKNGKVTALDKGTAIVNATLVTGENLTCTVKVKSAPKLNKSSATVKKGKSVRLTLSGKVSSINNKYTNTKYAKFTSKPSAKTLTIKGLKKGTTTLKVKINGVKTLKIKVKVK
ncbi:MAG: leucine-rich repeat domain-containing protein [Ruminococcus sp.]